MNRTSQIAQRLALLRCNRFRGWKWRDSLSGFGVVAGLALLGAGWGFSTARAESGQDEIAQRRAEQERPRTVVPFDPTQFDKYVGFYQAGPNAFFTITRKGDRFFTRLTGQRNVEVYPESPTKFFATVVPAQISFVTNAAGDATELVLHQNGFELHALKVDESVAKAGEAALARRIKSNTRDPSREAPLRRFIGGLIRGQPDLDDMAPGLIAATQQQWSMIEKSFRGAGALKSLTFERVNPQGMDIYLGTFENRKIEFLIGPLDSDHKMQGLLLRPPWNPHPGVPARAPAWSLRDLNGGVVASDQFKGKILVVDFWASWCAGCVAEMPGYVELQDKYGKDGVAFVGISVDQKATAAKKFVQMHGITYPIAMADENVASAFGVAALPATFIIDRAGVIVDRKEGVVVGTGDFEKALLKVLNPVAQAP